MGGTRQRYFIGINLKPHKLPKNAPAKRPTSRVHYPGSLPGRCVRRLLLESSTTLFINFLVDLAGFAILKEVIRTSKYQQAYHLFFDDAAGSILLA